MNALILNKEFKHPADGWYQIEPAGEHPNRPGGVVQVIDQAAIASICNRFNADADAGQLSHGTEMLVDHEHFKHEMDQESRAYGWLNRLQARDDGIYGRIRWSATGQGAVDGGDYRFFSTEYDPKDVEIIKNRTANAEKGTYIRPRRLDGLTLTNSPNNKGGKPITNRGEEFRRGADAPSAGTETNNQRKMMKSVALKLGLSADASEEAVLTETTKYMNRATEAEGQVTPLKNRIAELETENQTLLGEQVDALMDARAIKADDKVRNRLRPVLMACKNHHERAEALTDFGFKQFEGAAKLAQAQLRNRDTKPPGADSVSGESGGREEAVKAQKIMNRASELQKQMPTLSLASAVRLAQTETENAS